MSTTTTPHTQTAYKDTPIGKIPADWEVKRLGEIIKGKGEYGINAPAVPYDKNLPKYIRITDIDDEGNFSTEKITSVICETASDYSLKEGDILFVRTGATTGKAYLYKKDDGELVFAGFLIRFKIDDKIADKYFVWSYTKTTKYENWVRKVSQRSGQPGLNSNEYSSLLLPLPPLSEQKRIAEVLSTWDKAIQLTEQLIRQKEQRKKWLMQQLLTGKKRLKGFDRDWIKCNAADFLVQRNEQAPNNGSIPLFSLTIENGVTEKSDRYDREFLVKDKSNKNYKIVYPNDIVFNPANLRWGAIAKHTRTFKVLLSPIYEVLSVKKGYDIDFISYLVSSPRQIAYYASILEGTLIERMAVKVEPFLATNYEIPEIEEQIAIAQVLQAADKEISLLKTKAEKLREQKKGLMQQLLTGRKRLL